MIKKKYKYDEFHSSGEHVGAIISGIVIACLLGLVFFTAAQKKTAAGQIEIKFGINPNHAAPESLMRLPGIGHSRAEAIVAYRNRALAEGKRQPVFNEIQDLQKIRGIGPKTAQRIEKWLVFEEIEP